MKKLFSLVLVVAMMLSIFTFTASAGANRNFSVTYIKDGVTVTAADLAKEDIFLMDISLVNLDTLKLAGFQLTWNPEVLNLVKADGTVVSAWSGAEYRGHQNITVYDEDEGDDIKPFSTSPTTKVNSQGDLVYEIYTTRDDVTVAAKQNFLTLRFKVVGEGAANIAFTTPQIQEGGMAVSADVVPTFEAITIGGSTPDPEPETPSYEATEDEVNATQDWTSGEFKYPTDKVGGTDNAAVGKKVAAFGKAGTALTDGNYGIKIGNRFYPGRIDVPQGSYFAIIVVNTNGDEAIEGSYTYDIYTGKDSDPTWVATGLNAVVE